MQAGSVAEEHAEAAPGRDKPVPESTNAPSQSARPGRAEWLAVAFLTLLSLFSSLGFAIATPYGEAPDEHGHLLYVEHIVRYGRLPEIEPFPFSYESIQPPLYYMLGAGMVTAGRLATGKPLDAQIAPTVINNPEFQAGTSKAAFQHPAAERWPANAYALRALSALLGAGVVLLTYATARTLLPPPAPSLGPLLATAFAALIPQAAFVRGSISNENAASLAGALILWLTASHIMQPHSRGRVAWLGLAVGIGALSKLIVLPLVLPVVWALWVKRGGRLSNALRDLVVVAGLAALVAGWFFAYRWAVYGDPLAQSAAHEMLWHRSPFKLSDFFWFHEPFRAMLWKSFWGSFGWQQVWFPEWIYHVFAGVTVFGLLGGLYLALWRALTREQRHVCAALIISTFLVYASVVVVTTDQVIWQGREMFPVLSAVCVLLGLGLGTWIRGRASVEPHADGEGSGRRGAAAGWLVVGVVTTLLLALNIYAAGWLVWPALNG